MHGNPLEKLQQIFSKISALYKKPGSSSSIHKQVFVWSAIWISLPANASNFGTSQILMEVYVSLMNITRAFLWFIISLSGSAYIANDLLNALFKEHLHYIVNLRMVPWGNARVVGPHELFLCQVPHLHHILHLGFHHLCITYVNNHRLHFAAWPRWMLPQYYSCLCS